MITAVIPIDSERQNVCVFGEFRSDLAGRDSPLSLAIYPQWLIKIALKGKKFAFFSFFVVDSIKMR